MSRQAVAALHVLFVAPLLTYVGYCGKQTPTWVFNLLLALGIAVGLWHLYNWVKYSNATEYFRSTYLGIPYGEGFRSSYLGIPYGWQSEIPHQHAVNTRTKEGFIGMPFSFPYQDESTAYHSFHDKLNIRECNGKHCMHQMDDMDKANNIKAVTGKEGFVNPTETDDYGMITVTPYNHNNPKFGQDEEKRFFGDKDYQMSKHVCTGSPNCDDCCYSIKGNKTSPEYKFCMSGCIQGK